MFGEIIEGKGKAKDFLKMQEYAGQILEKIGFKPFAGTLNLRVNENELQNFLEEREKRKISGFEKSGKKFGSAVCYKIRVGGIPGAIIFPEKSLHEKNVIEVISFVNLKERLRLNAGDKIKLE